MLKRSPLHIIIIKPSSLGRPMPAKGRSEPRMTKGRTFAGAPGASLRNYRKSEWVDSRRAPKRPVFIISYGAQRPVQLDPEDEGGDDVPFDGRAIRCVTGPKMSWQTPDVQKNLEKFEKRLTGGIPYARVSPCFVLLQKCEQTRD